MRLIDLCIGAFVERLDRAAHPGPASLAIGKGQDFPAGPDPAASKTALVQAHCDPAVREPFIAALGG